MVDQLSQVQREQAEIARAKAEGREADLSPENLALYDVPVFQGAHENTPESEIVDKVYDLNEKFGGDSTDHESSLGKNGQLTEPEEVVDPNLTSAVAAHETTVTTAQNTVSSADEATGGLVNPEETAVEVIEEPVVAEDVVDPVGSEAEGA